MAARKKPRDTPEGKRVSIRLPLVWDDGTPVSTARNLPATRAECVDGPRPCVYLTCKHNLLRRSYDANEVELSDGAASSSCALDVVEMADDPDQEHGVSTETVATLMGLGPWEVEVIEAQALTKIRKSLGESDLSFAEWVRMVRARTRRHGEESEGDDGNDE